MAMAVCCTHYVRTQNGPKITRATITQNVTKNNSLNSSALFLFLLFSFSTLHVIIRTHARTFNGPCGKCWHTPPIGAIQLLRHHYVYNCDAISTYRHRPIYEESHLETNQVAICIIISKWCLNKFPPFEKINKWPVTKTSWVRKVTIEPTVGATIFYIAGRLSTRVQTIPRILYIYQVYRCTSSAGYL